MPLDRNGCVACSNIYAIPRQDIPLEYLHVHIYDNMYYEAYVVPYKLTPLLF